MRCDAARVCVAAVRVPESYGQSMCQVEVNVTDFTSPSRSLYLFYGIDGDARPTSQSEKHTESTPILLSQLHTCNASHAVAIVV